MYKEQPRNSIATDLHQQDQRVDERVQQLLDRMSLDEKIQYVGGFDDLAVRGFDHLGIPSVYASDASSGIRCFGPATSFPAVMGMAATWNVDLIREVGDVIGEEARAKGVSILLGPGVNIVRVPNGGRNFEYPGEDPFLTGEMAASYIKGVQGRGVITTVKHLACNNSEYDRHKSNSCLDERTLHEMYLPAFKKAVKKGGSMGLMTAYNQINGVYASEHQYLLQRVLREQWEFDGIVISDWDSLYSTEGPVTGGVDLEMPKAKWFSETRIKQALSLDLIREQDIEQMVCHLLSTFITMGVFDRDCVDSAAQVLSKGHLDTAAQTADEAMVLLKNDNRMLPKQASKLKHIIVAGRNGLKTATGGGGSSYMPIGDQQPSIYESLRSALPECRVEYVQSSRGRLHRKEMEVISRADLVIAAVGFDSVTESESYDRSWRLPDREDKLISQLAAANPNLAVILHGGGDMECGSWADSVPAIIHAFYLGAEAGDAVVRLLLGEINPSGKLPVSMVRTYHDCSASTSYYTHPEKMNMLRVIGPQGNPNIRRVRDLVYNEGLEVGYRHLDSENISPLFSFGHGLSFTEFTCEGTGVKVSNQAITATCTVGNIGSRKGAEVIQLYVSVVDPPVFRPKKELKGFCKVFLDPGESRDVSIVCDLGEIRRYDEDSHDWVLDEGSYEIQLGTSSRDIFYSGQIILS
jgi:beta-glucosidase